MKNGDFSWGAVSLKHRSELHPDLKRLVDEVLRTAPEALRFDIRIIEGHRTKAEQNDLFYGKPKRSWVKFPNSKHNAWPSNAVDMIPLPVNWNDKGPFNALGAHTQAIAKEMGIKIRWGGDWNMNGDWNDERNYDGPHFELRG